MDYRELAPSLQCGDIFLFHGTTPVSVLISAITHSPFSHVAMVYRLPGSVGGDGLRLWQSFEPEGGIVDDDLAGFLEKYIATEPGATLTCRQLSPAVTPAMAAAFAAFMAKVKGAKFPDYIPWIVGYLTACLGIETADDTYDCAQFVAESYMAAGLLKTWPLSRVYAPGRYAADTYELQLQLGRGFGPEIAVTIAGS